MQRVLFVSLITLILCFSCSDRDDDIDAVNIRIKNVSNIPYNSVQVGGEETVHMDIASGDFSDYLEYEVAYTYAYIRVEAEETYILQPIDFVGETPLSIGFYTYELNINEEGQIELNFVVD